MGVEEMKDFLYEILLLLLTFGNTCIIEFAVAFFMKIRNKKVYVLIFFVNMLTNPLVNLLYAYGSRWGEQYFFKGIPFLYEVFDLSVSVQILICLEILVILCETGIYHKFREWISHPFRYALLANLFSVLLGRVLKCLEIFVFALFMI